MHEYFAGCDTHKETHAISIINSKGQLQETFEITNKPEGWKKALVRFQKYPNLLCGIENSSNYARLFSNFLLANAQKLKEINPVFTGKKRKAHTCVNKNDQIDSIVIAKITRDEEAYLPDIYDDHESYELKLLTRQRDQLVKEQTRIKNRLHSKLTQINPSYKEIYNDFTTKKTLLKLENDFKRSKNVEAIVIFQDVKLLKINLKEIKNLEKILSEKQEQSTLLQNLDTLKGVDTITACKLVAIIGDINKFESPDKLASYAGIAPVEKSSGKYSKKFRNCKANRRLNTVIYIIALSQITHLEVASNYYQKKFNEGKTKKQAIHCLMRRLVKIIWMMYKHNQPYNYTKNLVPKTQELKVA